MAVATTAGHSSHVALAADIISSYCVHVCNAVIVGNGSFCDSLPSHS